MDLELTRHAEARMSQRGIRKSDVELVLSLGTDIGRGRFLLKKRSAAKEIGALKRQMARIERLAGKVLVIEDGHLVTSYHQTIPVRTS